MEKTQIQLEEVLKVVNGPLTQLSGCLFHIFTGMSSTTQHLLTPYRQPSKPTTPAAAPVSTNGSSALPAAARPVGYEMLLPLSHFAQRQPRPSMMAASTSVPATIISYPDHRSALLTSFLFPSRKPRITFQREKSRMSLLLKT